VNLLRLSISIGGRRFSFPSSSLGLTLLISRKLAALGLDSDALKANPALEAVRQVEINRDAVLKLIATATTHSRREAFSDTLLESRAAVFTQLPNEEIAQLLLVTLQPSAVSVISKETGIDREREEMDKAAKAKKDSSSLSFGGVSVWGRILDRACERYGWTAEYVLWGISYDNLRLMLADQVTSIYLTKEERHRAHVLSDRHHLRADDKANNALIAQMFHQG